MICTFNVGTLHPKLHPAVARSRHPEEKSLKVSIDMMLCMCLCVCVEYSLIFLPDVLDETRTFVSYVDAEDKIRFEERAQCDRTGQGLINQIKKLDDDVYLATNTDDYELAKSRLTPIADEMREISLELEEELPDGEWDLCSISGNDPYRYVPPRPDKEEFNMMPKSDWGGTQTKHVVPLNERLTGEHVLTALFEYSRSTSLGLTFATPKVLWGEPSKTVQRILGYTLHEHNPSTRTRNVECVIVCDEGVVVTGSRNSKG